MKGGVAMFGADMLMKILIYDPLCGLKRYPFENE